MRNIFIAGNWKMNKDAPQTEQFCAQLQNHLQKQDFGRVKAIVAPVNPFLSQANSILKSAGVAAQDVSAHSQGAFTGEVSASQLASLGIKYCIIGHSERRQYHGESDALVNEKLMKLRENRITPIVCIGETLEQREQGKTQEVVISQLEGCFQDVELQNGEEVLIAYEPVWAIGTGKTATSAQAQEVHAQIRAWLQNRFTEEVAQKMHILYGGSAKPENIGELLRQNDIDGGLIGGASLQIESFCAMLDIALETGGGN